MKKLGFILTFLFYGMQAQNFTEYRNLVVKAEDSESATKQYISKATQDFKSTKQPIYQCYVGIGNLLMAKHANNPLSKISYFNKGKKNLEEAVAKSPNNLEIRLLRYTSQLAMPTILGYKDNMAMDKKFLLENYKESNDSVLVGQIKDVFKI